MTFKINKEITQDYLDAHLADLVSRYPDNERINLLLANTRAVHEDLIMCIVLGLHYQRLLNESKAAK